MSSIDVKSLLTAMAAAATGVLKDKWPEVKVYSESEFRKMLETIQMIQKAKDSGEIDAKSAKILFDMQKNASRAVMLSIEGMGKIIVEQAINAALGVIKDTVNTAIGWKVL